MEGNSASRLELVAAQTAAMRDYNAYAVLLQDAIARSAGVNSADLQAVGVLMTNGPTTPGELASSIGLSAGGAITALVDRLEKAGYLTRRRDDVDRRRVLIEANTQKVFDEVGPIYARITARWTGYLDTLTDEQLSLLTGAFNAATEINHVEITTLRSSAETPDK